MARAVRERAIGPVELVDAHIERIEQVNPEINAFVLPRFEQAREQAKAAEQAVQAGAEIGPLHGVPYSAKECIEVEGMPVCDASKIFEGAISERNAVVIDSLNEAGAILLGKTNIPEFALHYDSNNVVYGATKNPHDRSRTVGGSSGGEAAALVSGMTAFGVGSDYGGSIRIPSAFCGSVGLKVGRHVIPYAGHFPATMPLSMQQWSVVGPMARYIEDLELLLPIFARPNQVREPDVRARSFDGQPADGLKVAAFWEDGVTPVEPAVIDAVRAAGAALGDAGHDVVDARPPMQTEARDVFVGIALAETGGLLAPLVEPRRDELSPQMQYIFSELVETADASAAAMARRFVMNRVIEQQVAAWQVEHPIAICPITPTPAYELGSDSYPVNGEEIRMIDSMSFCTYVNQLGLPAAAVPIAKSPEGLPIGIQVIGRRDHELQVLEVAKKLEAGFGGWMAPEGLATAAG
jgi:Asp-tRNA(Asn)/Glu-tRNA(Gln) amidotransferase A subunit family amidase